MDYRNADGSIAEMCGNGVRVFVRYLQRAGLVGQGAAVATRGGIKQVRAADGRLSVGMGSPLVLADRPVVTAAPALQRAGTAVELPNPHVVVPVGSVAELAALDLSRAPRVEPERAPGGQNVEFVVRTGERRLRLRVHERGVGETRSCGTGICAAVAATATAEDTARDGQTWRVDVPGGWCTVVWGPDGDLELAGPAEIVADIELDDGWLAARSA
jgi:diaminopimelate epimerase